MRAQFKHPLEASAKPPAIPFAIRPATDDAVLPCITRFQKPSFAELLPALGMASGRLLRWLL